MQIQNNYWGGAASGCGGCATLLGWAIILIFFMALCGILR